MIYVDKSEMIYELLDSNIYSIISRPNVFVKSLFLSVVSAIAQKDPIIQTLAIKHKFKKLKKHPVIRVSFSRNPVGVDIWVVNSCGECCLRRFGGLVCRKLYI